MGKVKEVITAGLEVLDEALHDMNVAKNEPLQFGYSEASSFYDGCKTMFKAFTPGFEVEVVDGHHELKGV